MELQSKSRSDSQQKWHILLCISTLWIASYFCILCNAALENDMVMIYNLSNTEFALFASISFGFAIIGSLITPYILKYVHLYNTMLISCLSVLFGQILFIIGLELAMHDRSQIYLMYCGRIYIGIGYGIQNVTVYSTVHVWFEHSQWSTFALNTVNSTFEIGVLITRYGMEPLYAYTHQLWMSHCIGVLLSVIAIAGCVGMTYIEKTFNSPISISSLLDNDYRKIRHLNSSTWLTIAIIVILWASIETFGNQFTLPFMQTFNISEQYANMVFSMSSLYVLSIGQFISFLISKYGYLTYVVVASLCLMTLSMTILYFYDINTWHVSPEVMACVIVIVLIIGLVHGFAASYACLFMVCPLQYSAIANSVCGILFMAASLLQSYFFGVIADLSSYSYAILMCIWFLVLALVISVILFHKDMANDGPLHKASKYNQYEILNAEIEEEYLT